jgi:hypothetical protein
MNPSNRTKVNFLRTKFFWISLHKNLVPRMLSVRHVTGTGSGLLGEIPRVVVQMSALTKRATIGVRAPYATRRKLWYEANQAWMNTAFISQGPQSSGI